MKKAVLLINMGSPLSKKEMREFLFNMFTDKAILPLPTFPRTLLALLISTFRSSRSWKKYEQIGGSKLKSSMDSIREQLQAEIGSQFVVAAAYSYSKPTIKSTVESLKKQGVSEIQVISMYPHPAFSTTGSICADLSEIRHKYPGLEITDPETYGDAPQFIEYWVGNIRETMQKTGFREPTLVFSAHAIPQYNVDGGDSYVEKINVSAKLIASKMGLDYRVGFQSKIGRIKWVGPDTKELLAKMKTEGVEEILLVPLSFVTENLETAYDQGIEILPHARNVLGIREIERVEIPVTHPLLISTFKKLLINI